MIITIDGPAGAGKSSVARALARELQFEFLDTGAMFRVVTLAALRAGIDRFDQDALSRLLDTLRLEMPPGRVLLNDEDVTDAIRTSEVTAVSGAIADSPIVRKYLAQMQRAIAEGRNIVTEGRDQGTVVFPQAGCKFFLTADPEERARRRQAQLAQRGEHVPLNEVLRAQQERDARDQARVLAPLKPAEDAVMVDSTNQTIDQVVEQMASVVRQKS